MSSVVAIDEDTSATGKETTPSTTTKTKRSLSKEEEFETSIKHMLHAEDFIDKPRVIAQIMSNSRLAKSTILYHLYYNYILHTSTLTCSLQLASSSYNK